MLDSVDDAKGFCLYLVSMCRHFLSYCGLGVCLNRDLLTVHVTVCFHRDLTRFTLKAECNLLVLLSRVKWCEPTRARKQRSDPYAGFETLLQRTLGQRS